MKDRIDEIIKAALLEDIGKGDITTLAIIPENTFGEADFLIKDRGIIAGLDIVEKVFRFVDPKIEFVKYFKDGSQVKPGDIVCSVKGKAASILTVERTALNFFQRMSGIASMTKIIQQKIEHTNAKIVDTRKTAPGLRILDKLAVKLSGYINHRMGLYDMFLIKDNHIAVAGSISKAVSLCKNYRTKNNLTYKIEVETKNIEEVKEAVDCIVDIIMLDNFQISKMKESVQLINGRCKIEASGNVSIDNVTDIAETGVDYISIGALTHSVKALDISLNIKAGS
ncbi:MAG TPA: carboxylating nicotinate-nucleotide diphosphorylase [Ignavibacteria bacterium]|nr:carboxylating nicotinate-nucleotide diphosphorylase [Ignavibacteria bacterium]